MFSITKLLFIVAAIAVIFLLTKNKGLLGKKEEEKQAIDTTNMVKDPICGTYVEEDSEYKIKFYDKVYRFCSQDCLDKFKALKQAESEKETTV